MKEKLIKYRDKLESEIKEYSENSATQRNTEALESMLECWEMLNECIEKCDCKSKHYEPSIWVSSMRNANGTYGEHWTQEQTDNVADSMNIHFDKFSSDDFYTAMNMMYSDYYNTAVNYKVDSPDFYASLSVDFLTDKDGKKGTEKMASYYNSIVK